MISVKRLCDSTANQCFSVESRLPDGKLQCITRSLKFKCNARGFDDADARAKALRFAITTDTLVQFRAFIFSEQDATAGTPGRLEGSVSSGSARVDAFLSLGSSPEGGKRRGIRSYVCLRQNRLTGLRFVVAMSRLENGRLRAVSFQDHSLAGAGTPEEALNKAVRFLRGVAFDSWRKQNMNDLMSRNHRDTFGHRRERALKHVSAFVEIETGEKVDCACGKNRSRGLMVACERCGAWEHAECQGFRSNKQIPADYICSACMRAEREDVVVIRLDEQGECANLQLEDLWTDVKPKEREVDESVCCICGCEDNQEFEMMVHPTTEHVCGDGATFAHPACISAAQNASNKNWAKHIARLGLCQICGDRLVKSPKEELHTSSAVSSVKNSSDSISPNTSSQARSSRRAAKTEQASRKRLRSALTNGGVAAKVELPEREKRAVKSVEEESDAHPSRSGDKADSAGIEISKVASTVLGRRFSDATVSVPIKKRKFQMLEVARSPSPPPRSPSPPPMMETVPTEREASAVTGLNSKSNVGHSSEDAEMVDGGSLETEAVTSPVVHKSGVGDSRDSGPAIMEKNLSNSEADRNDLMTRHPNNSSDTSPLSRSRQKEDHAACKESVKFGEKSRPSENGRVQQDPPESPHGQQSSILDNVHQEELLGARGGVAMVTEGEEKSKGPLVDVSKGINQEGISSGTHEPVRVNLSEKSHTSAVDTEMRELDERHVGTSRSSDLATVGPIRAASVRDPDCCSGPSRCEKDVSLDQERRGGQSSDVDLKDLARSSSASQGPSRDARLHWDLNMDMEEWERPPEEDTGTFAGVGLALAVPLTSSTDTDLGADQKVGTSNPKREAPPTPADSARVIASTVYKDKGIPPMEGSHTDCDGDSSSSDAGDAGTKPLEDSGGMESVVSTAPADVPAANVQEQQDVVVAVEQPLPGDSAETGNEESAKHSLPKSTAEESIKQYPGAEVNVGGELKSGADMLVDKIPPPEGQCSASTNAVEVSGKLSSDADFLGKFAASKVKGSTDESLQATERSKTLDGTANYDSNVLSADNYDFVEYDASDEEDDEPEERHSVGKPVPENKAEGLPTAELAQPGSPREWNEAPVEEMEAEHVDYDDSGDSRAGEEFASEADERADGEWRGNADAREPHKEDKLETGERNPVPAPDHFDAKVKGEVGSVSDGKNNLRADAPNDPSTVAELAKDEDMKDTAEDLRGERREPEIVMAKDRHAEEKIDKDSPELKTVERVENPLGKEEKRSHEDRDPSSSAARRGDGQNRAKSSGWDQLPEGFDNPDDALRAAKGNPVVRTGRGSPWGGSNGRGSSISPRGAPVSTRFGRGLRSDSISDRARSDDSWTREDHQHGIRGDDTVDVSPRLASPRELGRGRTHGRGGSPVVRARGRIEPWMDSPSGGPTSPWGPNRHPSPPGRYNDGVGFGPRGPANAAAVAAAKVESSGFVVAPDGTVTKAGSSSRGPPRPFQTGGRNGRGVMFNMGRGGPGMGMGVGMNLGGLRVNMGMGRGMSMGPGMAMNMGIGMGIGMGVGPGLGLGLPGRGGPGGRGMDVRYGGPYAGRGSGGSPLVEPSSSSRRGRSHEDYPDGWSRREERSVSPRKRRSLSRRSRSRSHSRSRSRTRSPRARSPRPTNSSGSGGGAGDKNLRKRSHSPVAHKPELKGERAESPPARRSVPPPPKLPLPPPPPRSQRSPPAGLKRLSDSKREGDRARSRDRERERERPAARARTPPRRTSPHVVHGSALMDERDRQLLAGIRQVSPAGGRHRPTENSGAVAAPAVANRDSPPDASPPATTGRVGDGNSEGRRQSGDEGAESRAQVPKREEAVSKLEQRSSKDNSRAERDRSGRRDGGRDRDEERRDVSKISYSSRDRDGRGSSSMRYNREGDDDVAPRRRRPSP